MFNFKRNKKFGSLAEVLKSSSLPLARFLSTYCDENTESSSSLLDQANEIRDEKTKIKTPPSFENLKNIAQQASVNVYDGFRFQVGKPLNLNTQVSHL